jgi:hypothetical protein
MSTPAPAAVPLLPPAPSNPVPERCDSPRSVTLARISAVSVLIRRAR